MKKKILATAIAATTATICAFGLTSCGGGNEPPKPTALEIAYKNYYTNQNMTVTVTDNRTEKFGNDYSSVAKVDYAHKTAYTKRYNIQNIFNVNWCLSYESYYEIDSNTPSLIIYGKNQTVVFNDEIAHIADGVWNSPIDRSDLFSDEMLSHYDSQADFEIHMLCNWVESYLPTHGIYDTCWRENANDGHNWASLDCLLYAFTESTKGFEANLYFCINYDGSYTPYACAVTIILDGQNRFKTAVLDFGTNGQITAQYIYGNTTVTVPEEAKTVSSIH